MMRLSCSAKMVRTMLARCGSRNDGIGASLTCVSFALHSDKIRRATHTRSQPWTVANSSPSRARRAPGSDRVQRLRQQGRERHQDRFQHAANGLRQGQTDTIVNGIKMAIDEYGGEIAGMKIEYLDRDDAEASSQRGPRNWKRNNARPRSRRPGRHGVHRAVQLRARPRSPCRS